MLVVAMTSITACGGSTRPGDADRQFVARMIPHHEVGVTLIAMAETHADAVRVRRLVFEMGGYHHSDMERLLTWQSDWSVSPASDFPGRIGSDRLGGLDDLSGTEFDIAWLSTMIDHHEGALDIARELLDADHLDDVGDLAESTITVQSDEIERMRELLVDLCPEPCPG